MTLQATIEKLAENFAANIVRALRGISLEDLATLEGTTRATRARATRAPKGGKRIRRSPEELQQLADHIVAIVKRHGNGIRAEELKREFGAKPGNVGAKVFTRPLAFALAAKKITKRGQRRATTYHAK